MLVRVGAGPLGILLGLSVGACFIKPDAPGGTAGDAGATGDGFPSDDSGAVTPCAIRDNFTGTTLPLCGDWGLQEGSADSGGNQNFYRSSTGQLVMASTGSGGFGACQSQAAISFTAVSVQILRAVAGVNARTGMQLTFGDSSTFSVELQGVGSATTLAVDTDGATSPVGGYMATMTNFRLEKNGANNIALTVSNGSNSTLSNNFYAPGEHDMVRIRLYTDFGSNTGYTLSEFDNLDGCAP